MGGGGFPEEERFLTFLGKLERPSERVSDGRERSENYPAEMPKKEWRKHQALDSVFPEP
jgi:hypothetical protein